MPEIFEVVNGALTKHSCSILTEKTSCNLHFAENSKLKVESVTAISYSVSDDKKAIKRTLSDICNIYNTPKKLRPIEEIIQSTEPLIIAEFEESSSNRLASSAMLNGHAAGDTQNGGGVQKKAPIATLANLGNTCFLNSILYTLRYAPHFLHNLHHLVSDLASVDQKLGSVRLKSSSLGRGAAGLAASGVRSWSSKDLLSLGQSESNTGKTKIQIATEKLHETFSSMRGAETKCLNSGSVEDRPEPFAAEAFLTALRDVNSTFEGNRQQDAHELLVCLLNVIRDTSHALAARAQALQPRIYTEINGLGKQSRADADTGKSSLTGLRKSWKKRKEAKTADMKDSPTEDRAPSPADSEKDEKSRPGWDFITENFEGTMVVRTMCLECETVTETSEAVCELCVPVGEEDISVEEPFREACLSTEYLCEQNKYECGVCARQNEARRSVAYARLPRLLVLQLKRFSGGMEKISRHRPTPRRMPCFCAPCAARPPHQPPLHAYSLWAVIMHLGQTLTGGHYVAYARDGAIGELKCEREGTGDAINTNTSSSFMRTLFNRPRPSSGGCAAKDCCVPRQKMEGAWLACDDEVVKPITDEEFDDLLSAEPKLKSAATPYLLFYVRSEVA